MIAGHFGLAAAFKKPVPEAPLWALMLGTAWLDVVFIPLLAVGAETIGPAPGTSGGYGNNIIHADYTHSLVGAAALSALYGFLFLRRHGRRVAAALAAVAFSHWLLDLLVHRMDMPILPGNAGGLPLLGFGLWRYPMTAAAIELALVVAGALLYRQAARQAIAGAGRGDVRRADLVSSVLLGAGVLVLLLDFSGLVG